MFLVMYEEHGYDPEYIGIAQTLYVAKWYIANKVHIMDWKNFPLERKDKRTQFYSLGSSQYTILELPVL